MTKKKESTPLPSKDAVGQQEAPMKQPSVPYPDLEEFEQRHHLLTVDPGVPYEKQPTKKRE